MPKNLAWETELNPDLPTYEPVHQMSLHQKEIERIITAPPRLKPWVRRTLGFIGGFFIGFIVGELFQRFVFH
jgi:hypothetical protein